MQKFTRVKRHHFGRFLLLLSFINGLVQGASFYGDGFVHLKTVESSRKNSLHVRFRTASPNGLLFLAAGETDFLWVALYSGCVQVLIELGSGERTLWSEKGIHFNDLLWHSIDFEHDEYNVTLAVDKTLHSTLRMLGPDLELSVQEGFYVGGLGNLDKIYLFWDMRLVGFRGCIDEVLFNEHNLLSSLRPYSGYKIVHEVSLGCSSQFTATVNESISFFSSKAYVSLPMWEVPQEGFFECELYMTATKGLLLYSSARQGDYVALEVQDSHMVAAVKIDGDKTILRSITAMNEGMWNLIRLYLSPRGLQLTVGEEVLNSSLGANSRPLLLSGPLFVGGVDVNTRPEDYRNGVLSVVDKQIGGGSFKGCLRKIRVNGRNMGLPDAMVTKDVSVGCELVKPVEPITAISAETAPLSMETLPVLDKKKAHQTVLLLQDLEVLEGGQAPLQSNHIKMNLDFHNLEISQSQIMFRIEEQPVHGQLRLDVDSNQGENTFSMLDLENCRVMYVHGGSEDPLDFFMFSVFTSSKAEMPGYLKGNRLYRFNISVKPSNDAPELFLPEGNLFILLENSKRRLTIDILRVTDPDTSSTDLIFTGDFNADTGFLELKENPGQSVNSFSYSDLKQSKVSFVHTGIRNSQMSIRVSDGEKMSNTVVLRIMAVPLEYRVVNNTGVEVCQGGATHISNQHLAVQLNMVKQALDIHYDLIEPPVYGELQRLHSSGEWKQTSTFTQKLLEKERLRYLSTFRGTQLSNVTDSFKCKVTIDSLATDEVSFVIRIQWIYYKVTRSKIEIDSDRKVTLTPQMFRVVSKGIKLPEDNIHICLLTVPRRGYLLLGDEALKKNSTFSQKNITNHKLQYKLFEKASKNMKDIFSFQVFSKYSYSNKYDFRINIKADVHNIVLKNHGLSLLEGESKVLTKDMLFSDTFSSKEVHYIVTRSPRHGELLRRTHSNSSLGTDSIMEFSNKDILEERILYVHDDSETTYDAFMFLATVSPLKDEAQSSENTFNISIQLINDEKPVCVVNKVFHVVRDSQRLLTLEDLCFHDPDSDYDDGQLLYTRRVIPMGDLVLVNNISQKLYQFRQMDLQEKRVMFVHKGVSSGHFVLFISDGKHYTSTLIEVSAQDPFLKVANNTGLLVQKGQKITLKPANISVTTNTDVRSDEDVLFEIFYPPSYGTLFCEGVEVDIFTQYDLKAGNVVYHHDNSRNMKDYFSFFATVNGLRLDVTVAVRMYLESHHHPPRVIHNYSIMAEEGKAVKIHTKQLEVIHEDNTPDEIVYFINTPPLYGFLRRYLVGESQYEKPIRSFSQMDINAGQIQYVEVKPGQSSDSFNLNVTNGILTVSDLTVSVDIIPLYVPLEVSNITVKEGSSKALTQEVIRVTNRHFRGIQCQYYVTVGPHHGRIEYTRIPGVPILSFTGFQVEHEFIYYVHDGSETTADNFTLVANVTELRKYSLPCVIQVSVKPVNDEAPVVTANRILRVWVDSITEITAEVLSAEDHDSSPESLEFIITPPSNGHLALKSAPSRPVLNFTQTHILNGQLVFAHSGALSGGFHFQVNDGINFAARQIFSVTAQSLVLSLERNRELKVFPGSSKLILVEDLLIITNDYDDVDGNRTIIFSVISPPSLGKLFRIHENNPTEMKQISMFTQNMVKTGLVLYKHTEPVRWAAADSFIFKAFSPPAFLQPHTFNIHISYDNKGPEHRSVLLANTGAVVDEGSRVLIDKSHLDASNLLGKVPKEEQDSYEIWFGVNTLPRYGTIVIGEWNLTHEKPKFSQSMFSKHGMTYVHDDSETTSDSFSFDIWLIPKGKPTQRPKETDLMVSELFNITVTPVNDQPPFLKTQSPHLRVVKGETVALGPENLQVEDHDTPPGEIYYTVISKPKNGFLALEEKMNECAVHFTQEDVNKRKLFFVQHEHSTSEILYFSVTDGFHHPLYKLFSIEVENITITVVNNTGLTLVQGQTTVSLTFQHLAVITNKKNISLKYHVTSPPGHGHLMLMEEVVTTFDQEDLQSEKVSYHMTDMSSSQDSFEIAVLTSEYNLTNQAINVTVKPLIHLGEHIRIPEGIPVKLRKDVLDATELAFISASDPIFEIIIPPKHAKVVKVTFNLSDASQSVQSFSFRDIEQGRVAIEAHINLTATQATTTNALKDSFMFLLKAANIQPATGEFVYLVLPYDPVTGKHIITEPTAQTTQLPTSNRTTNVASPANRHPHTHSVRRPHRVHLRNKARHRWGNHTRVRPIITTVTPGKHIHSAGKAVVNVESFLRPAADPLLIILPSLACLLLIVILVILILVFRHRREKRACPAITENLSGSSVENGAIQSPYLGQPERSLAVPSVVVTPMTPRFSETPVLETLHNAALVHADSSLLICTWNPIKCPDSPTLRQNQYWV